MYNAVDSFYYQRWKGCILKNIEFEKARINVLMIEFENHDCLFDRCEVRRRVRQKMREEGYKRYGGMVVASDIYVHPNSTLQIPESVRKPDSSVSSVVQGGLALHLKPC